MTCGGNRAKGPTPPFPPFPPLLEIPQKTRDFHIPTATTTSGLRLTQNRTPKPQKPNPGKIEGLVRFSCRALFRGNVHDWRRHGRVLEPSACGAARTDSRGCGLLLNRRD